MTVKERILAIRVSENVRRQPHYAEKIGVSINDRVKRSTVSNKEYYGFIHTGYEIIEQNIEKTR